MTREIVVSEAVCYSGKWLMQGLGHVCNLDRESAMLSYSASTVRWHVC